MQVCSDVINRNWSQLVSKYSAEPIFNSFRQQMMPSLYQIIISKIDLDVIAVEDGIVEDLL